MPFKKGLIFVLLILAPSVVLSQTNAGIAIHNIVLPFDEMEAKKNDLINEKTVN